MRIIKQILINIIISWLILYIITKYVPELGFVIKSDYKDTFIIFWIIGFAFWIINSLLKSILKILTIPIKYLTLWISSLIINIVVLYIFEQVVNYLDIGITVSLGTISQTFILSLIITAIYFLIKKLI